MDVGVHIQTLGMYQPWSPVPLILLLLLLSASGTESLRISGVAQGCINPSSQRQQQMTNNQGIEIQITAGEFYDSFASIFRLSDGSSISAPEQERMESLRYMQELLYAIGVYVDEGASRQLASQNVDGDILRICGKDVVNLLLLAAVGNFVAGPGDTNISPQSSMKSMPSVVIDAYTGQLVMHTPYDAVRGYFVEALLVISIIVISRLTFVRNNVYTTVVEIK